MKRDVSAESHSIKHREQANDEFTTPGKLVHALLPRVPVRYGDLVCDNAASNPVWFHDYPLEWRRDQTDHFEEYHRAVDWFITNPPYSVLDWWLDHSTELAQCGFAYLLAQHAVTPRRLERMGQRGFGLTAMHLCKVGPWYGIAAFCIWEARKKGIVTYDRTVWR